MHLISSPMDVSAGPIDALAGPIDALAGPIDVFKCASDALRSFRRALTWAFLASFEHFGGLGQSVEASRRAYF